jgi:hypothetical protein
VVTFTPRPLYHRVKLSRYPLDVRLAEPQSRCGHCGVEKNPLSLLGIEPRSSIPSLHRLSYPGSCIRYIFRKKLTCVVLICMVLEKFMWINRFWTSPNIPYFFYQWEICKLPRKYCEKKVSLNKHKHKGVKIKYSGRSQRRLKECYLVRRWAPSLRGHSTVNGYGRVSNNERTVTSRTPTQEGDGGRHEVGSSTTSRWSDGFCKGLEGEGGLLAPSAFALKTMMVTGGGRKIGRASCRERV